MQNAVVCDVLPLPHCSGLHGCLRLARDWLYLTPTFALKPLVLPILGRFFSMEGRHLRKIIGYLSDGKSMVSTKQSSYSSVIMYTLLSIGFAVSM